MTILVSIVVSIPACHAGDRGSIPRRGDFFFLKSKLNNFVNKIKLEFIMILGHNSAFYNAVAQVPSVEQKEGP